MSEEVKYAVIIASLVLVLCALGFASCNYQAKLDAQAPVVETCIKHPATRSPLGSMQR